MLLSASVIVLARREESVHDAAEPCAGPDLPSSELARPKVDMDSLVVRKLTEEALLTLLSTILIALAFWLSMG